MSKFKNAVHLLSNQQKTAKGVSLYSRWINRPAGRILAASAHSLGMTPNQVTLASALTTAVGVALIASLAPTPPLALLITACLVLGFALDSADGQLARLQGGGSVSGEWLDHIVDAGKMVALHSAVLICWYRFFDVPEPMYLVPLLFQLCAVVTFTGGTLTDLLKRKTAGPRAGGRPSNVRAVALLAVDYGVFCFIFLLIPFHALFVLVYTILAVVRLIFLVAFLAKWYSELRKQ